ncbi:cupin domain-containing protein [Parerythrobacter aestuarii]|uniref:hypothetical protein n=1 Tax=Parerythrobacter aestuarii TaxID=3020909 RepID=UPI0024DE5B59|nr:hypothetical protein [Parerythrobacter aestuarii]
MDLLNNRNLVWDHYLGDESCDDTSFNWPIDYQGTVLDVRDDGHLDVLYRWAPNAYCHFHRHTAPTTSLVLEGELHVTEVIDGEPGETRVRKRGDWAHRPETEDHMERGGPDGALVLFSIYAPDGILSQRLDKQGNVLVSVTMEMLKARQAALV